jgi:hypothetical protein
MDGIPFTVEMEDRVHKYYPGDAGIPITFDITSHLDENQQIDIQTDFNGVGEITWQDVEGDEFLYEVLAGETISVTGLLYIYSDTLGGTYTLTFYFINQYGFNLSKTLEIEIMGPLDDDDDDTDDDDDEGFLERMGSGNTCFICCLIGLVVIILIVITVVFIRRSSKGSAEEIEE